MFQTRSRREAYGNRISSRAATSFRRFQTRSRREAYGNFRSRLAASCTREVPNEVTPRGVWKLPVDLGEPDVVVPGSKRGHAARRMETSDGSKAPSLVSWVPNEVTPRGVWKQPTQWVGQNSHTMSSKRGHAARRMETPRLDPDPRLQRGSKRGHAARRIETILMSRKATRTAPESFQTRSRRKAYRNLAMLAADG